MPRPKGTPNKATTTAREAFQALLDGRVAQLGEWIDRVARDDPHKAFTMTLELAKYCVPRAKNADPPAPVPTVVINTAP